MTEGQQATPERRVKVVYCGGCNPHIDRGAVAADLPADDPNVPGGATVHLSGCPRACASGHELTADAPQTAPSPRGAGVAPRRGVTVVVAGELVDGVPTPAADIAPTVARKLKE